MFKNRKQKQIAEKGGIEIIGEALHLLRTAPLNIIVNYYIGTMPFILAFLYFCSDMSKSAFAEQRCLAASLMLAFAFLWMKCWQAVFADALMCQLMNKQTSKWNIARIIRLAKTQTVLQPLGLIIIPLAFIVMLPFYCTHAFYQNVTVLGNGETSDTKNISKRCYKQALLWPKQNHMLIWLANCWMLAILLFAAFSSIRMAISMTPEIHNTSNILWLIVAVIVSIFVFIPLCPLGTAIAGNVALLLIVLPNFLHSILGIETVFTLGGWSGILSTTFIMSVFGITYMILDPLIKSAHVLRCFYGEARASGNDLLIELKHTEKKQN